MASRCATTAGAFFCLRDDRVRVVLACQREAMRRLLFHGARVYQSSATLRLGWSRGIRRSWLNPIYDHLAAQAVPCLRYAWHHLMGCRRPRRLALDVPARWYILGHPEFVSATASLALVHNLRQHWFVIF